MPRGITTGSVVSVYRGMAGLRRGTTVDREITEWINHDTPPKSSYGQRIVTHIASVMCVSELQAQVRVKSATHVWATALDAVALKGPRVPRVMEFKTTGFSMCAFRRTYDLVDPIHTTTWSMHTNSLEANTPRRRYSDQLSNGMNMYAHVHEFLPNTIIHGSLIVVCRDGIIGCFTIYKHNRFVTYYDTLEYNNDAFYVKNSGINMPHSAPTIVASTTNSSTPIQTPGPARRLRRVKRPVASSVAVRPSRQSPYPRARTKRPVRVLIS